MNKLVFESLNEVISFEREGNSLSKLGIGRRKLIEDWFERIEATNYKINPDLTVTIEFINIANGFIILNHEDIDKLLKINPDNFDIEKFVIDLYKKDRSDFNFLDDECIQFFILISAGKKFKRIFYNLDDYESEVEFENKKIYPLTSKGWKIWSNDYIGEGTTEYIFIK